MAEPNGIVVEYLVHIRRTLDAIREDVRDMMRPVGVLENRFVNMSTQLDRIEVRLARIEQRLDLTNA